MEWEKQVIANELIQGIEFTKQLRQSFSTECTWEMRDMLIQKILSTYDRALMVLHSSETSGMPLAVAPILGLPESPDSRNGSGLSGDFDEGLKNQQQGKAGSKKRKVAAATWSEQVRICTDNGLEGNTDDGYSWRKYGQKDILGAKYPRSYYRCTYRNVHDCWARKQVQRTDEDPTVFEITYKGKHTCNRQSSVPPPRASPEKHEMKHNHQAIHLEQQQASGDILSSLRANLRVDTEELNNIIAPPFSFPSASFTSIMTENEHFPFPMLANEEYMQGYSSSFISPATSGSNYFTTESPCQINSMLSANTSSATNSSIGNMAFSTDNVDLDSSFPF